MAGDASELVSQLESTLADGGIDLLAAIPVADYDRAAPPAVASQALLPGARALIVVGSGGRALWRRFGDWLDADPRAKPAAVRRQSQGCPGGDAGQDQRATGGVFLLPRRRRRHVLPTGLAGRAGRRRGRN